MKKGEKITLGVVVVVFTYLVTYFYISGYQKQDDLVICIDTERQNYPTAVDEDLKELCTLKSQLRGFLGDDIEEIIRQAEIEQASSDSNIQIEGREDFGGAQGEASEF